MKLYTQRVLGNKVLFDCEGGYSNIVEGSRLHALMLDEIARGDAEMVVANLNALKAEAVKKVKAFATDARAKLTGYADPYQLAGWIGKSEIAKRVIASTATVQEIVSIQAEVDKRGKGETVEYLANKQLEKSIKLTTATAIIDGLESSAITAIKSKQKESTLATLMETLLVDAEAELQALLGANQ